MRTRPAHLAARRRRDDRLSSASPTRWRSPASPRSSSPARPNGSKLSVERQGRRLEPDRQSFRRDRQERQAESTEEGPRPTRYFQPRPSADRLRGRRHLLRQPRPQQRRRARSGARKPRRLPEAREALRPAPDQRPASRSTRSPSRPPGSTPTSPRPTPGSRRTGSPPSATCRSPQVDDLISDHTDGRFLGLFGEPGVNVLELNLALDKEAPLK